MPDPKRNVGASIRQRLLNLARQRNQGLELLLTRYALERLLHRLGRSRYRERFVLKGAMLLTIWIDDPTRATRDVDLLGFGDPTPDALITVFREIMNASEDDGLEFNVDELRIDNIRENVEYGGSRLRTTATLAGARIPVVIDIGFGDATEPGLGEIDLPVLLDQPRPSIRGYAPETVVAEKLHAIVLLGLANSRMKDYYDVWTLLDSDAVDHDRLVRALVATFQRRATPLPNETPVGLTDEFAADTTKRRQWDAYREGTRARGVPLDAIVKLVRQLLAPSMAEAATRS
jgi:predicted nucleotidyltransferase component of viral defense system